MPVLTEPNHTGEFIVTEANGYRSRGEGQVASGNDLVAGAVVQLTAGEYVPVVDAATDPVGVLYAAVDATSAATDGVFLVRDAEVARGRLTFPVSFLAADEDEAIVRLEAQGIKVV